MKVLIPKNGTSEPTGKDTGLISSTVTSSAVVRADVPWTLDLLQKKRWLWEKQVQVCKLESSLAEKTQHYCLPWGSGQDTVSEYTVSEYRVYDSNPIVKFLVKINLLYMFTGGNFRS